MPRTNRLLLGVSMSLAVTLAASATFRARAAATSKKPAEVGSPRESNLSSAPLFGAAFWKQWGDGRGELAGYDLTFPRYREARKGVAVTVFVAETFSNSLRVKSDSGKHPSSDEFPVMKLNLMQDFPTGIYDYNLITSAFVALSSVNGRPAGSATKVSFSSQEWCGSAYGQLLFDPGSAPDVPQLLRRRSRPAARADGPCGRGRRGCDPPLGTRLCRSDSRSGGAA